MSDKLIDVSDKDHEEICFTGSKIDPILMRFKVEKIFEARWPWKTLQVESIEFLGEKDVGYSNFTMFYLKHNYYTIFAAGIVGKPGQKT